LVDAVDLLTILAQYGLAGVALYLLYQISYHRFTSLEQRLARLEEKLEQVRLELARLREEIRKS